MEIHFCKTPKTIIKSLVGSSDLNQTPLSDISNKPIFAPSFTPKKIISRLSTQSVQKDKIVKKEFQPPIIHHRPSPRQMIKNIQGSNKVNDIQNSEIPPSNDKDEEHQPPKIGELRQRLSRDYFVSDLTMKHVLELNQEKSLKQVSNTKEIKRFYKGIIGLITFIMICYAILLHILYR